LVNILSFSTPCRGVSTAWLIRRNPRDRNGGLWGDAAREPHHPGAVATIPPRRSASNSLVQFVNGWNYPGQKAIKRPSGYFAGLAAALIAVEECGSNLLER
jgi:hypothetical protein